MARGEQVADVINHDSKECHAQDSLWNTVFLWE